MDIVSNNQKEKIHPHKFTMWVAIASIIMMFAGLTSAFIVKSNQANWEEVDTPTIFWVSTIVLIASSVTIQMALRAIKQREMKSYRLLISATAILGVVFVILQWFGFEGMWRSGIRFQGSGAGQFLYIIAGLHALHVIGGIVALIVTALRAMFGKNRSYSSVPVEVISTYWHFVDILWIYLLVFFIWIG